MRSLDNTLLANALLSICRDAYDSLIWNSDSVRQTELRNAMRDIRIGDLVIEITMAGIALRGTGEVDPCDCVGIVDRVTQEPIPLEKDFIWDVEMEGKPHPSELVVYIRSFNDKEVRWTNSSFVRCPLPAKYLRPKEQALKGGF